MSRTILSKEIFEKFFEKLSQEGFLNSEDLKRLRELYENGDITSEAHLDTFLAGVGGSNAQAQNS